MAVRQCRKCEAENPAERFFCGKCGALLDSADFTSEKVYETEELKLARILENLKYIPHTPIHWRDTADVYARRVEHWQAMLGLPEFQGGPDSQNERSSIRELRNQMEDFLEQCRKPEFQIAFVGTIKTGKSTLINALLGHNYASMAVTPETAALTKFRSSTQDYVHVTFYSQEEWDKLWNSRTSAADAFMKEYEDLGAERQRVRWVGHPPIHRELRSSEIESELKTWSSSKYAEHYFVKEIEVGISNLPADFPPQVVLVDTPGLSDPVAYRSELTRGYIRRANAVFVCVDAQKIQKEEIETISSVFSFSSHNKNKVHIIATHWDNLNQPEKDWAEQKAWMQKRLVGKGFFDTEKMAEKNILYSAAYIYNLCREFDRLSNEEKIPLFKMALNYDIPPVPEDLKRELPSLMRVTNVDNIRAVLVNELANQYSELLWQDMEQKYQNIKFNVRRIAKERRDAQLKLLETTRADSAQIEAMIDAQRKGYEEITQCSAQLEAAMRIVERSTKDLLANVQKAIDEGIAKAGENSK